MGVCSLAGVVGASGAVWGATRLAPAEAMRPPAPASFRPTVLERLGMQRLLSPAMLAIDVSGMALLSALVEALPHGFIKNNTRCHRHVQRPYLAHQRNAHPGIGPLQVLRRNAVFLTTHDDGGGAYHIQIRIRQVLLCFLSTRYHLKTGLL